MLASAAVSMDDIAERIERQLARLSAEGADRDTVERLLAAIGHDWHDREYFDAPPQVRDAAVGAGASVWHAVLLREMQLSGRDRLNTYTPEQRRRFIVQYDRILRHTESDGYAHPSRPFLRRNLFLKDLGLARTTMLPVNGRVLDVYARIPRRPLLTGLPASAPFYWKALVELGGFSPYIGVHLHIPMHDGYTAGNDQRTGFLEDFLIIAEFMARMPQIRGTLGYGWLQDPALTRVAPHLAHAHTMTKAYGAQFLDMGTDDDTVRSALARSKTRQQLYDEGKYRPRSFIRLWGRADMLRCLDDYRAGRLRA
jgi:hypothetical protein